MAEMAIAKGLSAPLNFMIPRFRSDTIVYSVVNDELTVIIIIALELIEVKAALIILTIAIGFLGLLELALRLVVGLGNPLVYVADEQIGYRLAPSQRTRRFGNRIEINEYSQRGPRISAGRSPSTLRVLLLGDSIANGSWWTDGDETISTTIARQLQAGITTVNSSDFYSQIEVLNASANSWGPRNELAYLQRFGMFDSQMVVLLINTDDLFSTAPTSIPVGRDRYYPSTKPPLAIVEAFVRLAIPYKSPPEMAAVRAEKGDRVGFNLEAISKIQELSGPRFLLAMTPLLREIGQPGPRDYELKARRRLMELTQTKQMDYIDFLPLFNATPFPESLYRDHIHPSPQGNQLISRTISQYLQQYFTA